ncbi:hypothetical protein SLEP1_g55163 [Rubroshorea leprosula]|uniref:Transmembrane protein n=1 Tax=Rubroshorea leprosula TaxID=152421 RepID=A0AAV5MEL4_9ROSI|nr:hypothetical protein SLEP1_g55163 [Rubroshorea leprosula]
MKISKSRLNPPPDFFSFHFVRNFISISANFVSLLVGVLSTHIFTLLPFLSPSYVPDPNQKPGGESKSDTKSSK